IDQGLNVQQYVREFIGRVRDLLVLKLGLDEKVLGNAEEKRALATRASAFSEQDLIRFFDMLLRLESELRWTSQFRFHLEVGFIKRAKVGYVRDIEEVLREVKDSGPSQAPSPARQMPEPKRTIESRPESRPEPRLASKPEERPGPPAPVPGTFADDF